MSSTRPLSTIDLNIRDRRASCAKDARIQELEDALRWVTGDSDDAPVAISFATDPSGESAIRELQRALRKRVDLPAAPA